MQANGFASGNDESWVKNIYRVTIVRLLNALLVEI